MHMISKVNTVTGPIAVNQLGKTLMHEHFVFGYPGFAGDATFGPFDKSQALAIGVAAAQRAKLHGVQTIVDATPNDSARQPE